MKTTIKAIHMVNGLTHCYVEIPEIAMAELGWKANDTVSLDIPLTGGGLRITRKGDPITLMGGVKEAHGPKP